MLTRRRFLQSTALSNGGFGTNLKVSDGLPPPPGVDPNRVPAGATRSTFDVNFRDAYSTNFNFNVQRQLGHNYMLEIAYAGSRARQMLLKTNENQAPATLGVTNPNVNRPFFKIDPALGDLGTVTSNGFLNYNGLLVKFYLLKRPGVIVTNVRYFIDEETEIAATLEKPPRPEMVSARK